MTAVALDVPQVRRRLRRPQRLLTQNSELREEHIWNWTLPALATRLRDGRVVKTCPAAGVCASGVAALTVSHAAGVALGGGCPSCVCSGVRCHRV
ncbi:hypothetical protein AB0903_08300, partial [Streptomyces sp. NPDC048389]